jgi:hypothetical protein
MEDNAKSPKSLNIEEKDGLLAEYKTLRDEILAAQGRRLQTVSFAVGAFGVIFSIVASAILGSNRPTPEMCLYFAVGGGVALYGIVIPGLIMTISLQQSIQHIGSYIRNFIEPLVPGLNWENQWRDLKSRKHLSRGLAGISGIFGFLTILPWLLPLYALTQALQYWPAILILIPFTVISFLYSYDIHYAKSKGWKEQWDPGVAESSLNKKRASTGSRRQRLHR